MPIACPACGRPNADNAPQCVYCTESLKGLARDQPSTEHVSSQGSRGQDRHLIILAPQPPGDDRRVALFAEAAGVNAYDARLALLTERPRLLRKMDTAEEAESLSARLRQAGIAHFTVAEADLMSIAVVPIRNMELLVEDLRLGLAEGRLLVIPYRALSLLVQGEIVRERHRERLLGTIRGANQALTPSQRLHFYAREARVVAELDPEQFDWSVLGERRTTSTLINFRRLVEEILERAPDVMLDRGFDWEPVVLSRAEQEENAGMGAALAGEGSARESAVYDNEAQFRFYSRWRYLVQAGPAERVE
jgi:hypothetical protein